MTTCSCFELPKAFYVEDGPSTFRQGLIVLERKDWMLQCECPDCQTLWVIDEWDKYIPSIACRIVSRESWQTESDVMRKQFVIEVRGGNTEEICQWRGCDQHQVNDSAFCVDHMFEFGVLR